MTSAPFAPEWRTSLWLNTRAPLSLASLRGRPVLAVAFQMLCPGCAASALPLAMRARQVFANSNLAVVGLHTVFEHHQVQGRPEALAAFLHEYRIDFPVGIDEADPAGGLPLTMQAYAMQGTPTWLLIDREGRLRARLFGHVDDLKLGALIAGVAAPAQGPASAAGPGAGCDEGSCSVRS